MKPKKYNTLKKSIIKYQLRKYNERVSPAQAVRLPRRMDRIVSYRKCLILLLVSGARRASLILCNFLIRKSTCQIYYNRHCNKLGFRNIKKISY